MLEFVFELGTNSPESKKGTSPFFICPRTGFGLELFLFNIMTLDSTDLDSSSRKVAMAAHGAERQNTSRCFLTLALSMPSCRR